MSSLSDFKVQSVLNDPYHQAPTKKPYCGKNSTPAFVITLLTPTMVDDLEAEKPERLEPLKPEVYEQHVASNRWGIRHVQIAVMAAAAFVAFALRINLSVAIVAMVRYGNYTSSDLAPTYDWSEDVQGYLLSSFFWMYSMIQIPAGIITTRFGGHHLLCLAILGSSTLTILLPQCAYIGGWILVCINRTVQGLCQGFLFPSIYTLLGVWAPPQERSRFASFALGAQLMGMVTTSPLAGYLCATFGWPSVFYTLGSAGIAVGILMLFFGSDTPGNHRMISEHEKKYIQSSLGGAKVQMNAPWKNVFTSVPYWSALIGMCSQAVVNLMFLTKIPTYLATVLKFDMEDNGLLTALPYFVSYLLTFVFAWACDFAVDRQLLSLTNARKVLNSIANFGSAICVIVMAHTDNRVMAVIFLTAFMGAQGAAITGVQANFVDLAPNFSGTIFSVANFFCAALALTGPIIVGYIVTEVGSAAQWRIVFYLCAAILALGNIVFILVGTAETQWWNWPEKYSDKHAYEKSGRKIDPELRSQGMIEPRMSLSGCD